MTDRDRAYVCFAYIGALAVVVLVLGILPLSFSTFQVLGMVVGIPAVLLALGAAIIGMGLTILRAREWPLVVMSLSLLGCLTIFMIGESFTGEQYRQHRTEMNLLSGFLMTIVAVLSGRWYFFDFRRRKK